MEENTLVLDDDDYKDDAFVSADGKSDKIHSLDEQIANEVNKNNSSCSRSKEEEERESTIRTEEQAQRPDETPSQVVKV